MDHPTRCGLTRRELKRLLRRSRSAYIGERSAAEREFRDLGADGINALTEFVDQKARAWRRRRRVYFGLVACYAAVFVSILIYCILVTSGSLGPTDLDRAENLWGELLGGLGGGLGGSVLGGFAWLLAPPQDLFFAARLLAQAEDPRSVGPLARSLGTRFADAELRHSVALGLVRLLPLIDEPNASYLSSDERDILGKYLLRSRPERESDLVFAIIGVLSRTGDTATLRTLRAFQKKIKEPQSDAVTSGAFGPKLLLTRIFCWRRKPEMDSKTGGIAYTGSTQGLREVTAAAIDHLAMRVGAASEGSTLLRAYGENADDGGTLLRPTACSAETEPDQLLRASVHE